MPSEPRENLLRSVGGHEHVERTAESDPAPDEGAERLGLTPAVRCSGACCRSLGATLLRATAGDETEPGQDPARLVRREVRAVEPGRRADRLFWREAAGPDDDIVIANGLGELVRNRSLDEAARKKLEPLANLKQQLATVQTDRLLRRSPNGASCEAPAARAASV